MRVVDFLQQLRGLLQRLGDQQGPELAEAWQGVLRSLVARTSADASALLVVHGPGLRPVAIQGLPEGVAGRTFVLQDHPRLEAIAKAPGVCRFAADCGLPDPYDGLLDDGLTPVHDCLGVPLRDGGELIGMLTLDALTPGALADLDDEGLLAAAELLGTCLRLSQRLDSARLQLALNHAPEGHRNQRLVGWRSATMRKLMASVELVAATDMSVLVHGETGVGKERIAHALHHGSRRAGGPLVVVNCAALPASLIESTLFGHRRGAFSGAVSDHKGHFQMADGGTLVLDEVGELPLELQPKLLRVLQEGEIQPLGSDQLRHVDVRVVAVTNRDLAQEVTQGRFREDLYHRLSAFPLEVPPLRQRLDDVMLLAGHFLEQNRVRLGVGNLRLSDQARAALLAWHWPGNVRELESLLARASLLAMAEVDRLASPDARRRSLRIDTVHLGLKTPPLTRSAAHLDEQVSAQRGTAHDLLPLREATDEFQRDCISQALAMEQSWAGTARRLGMDPGNLHRLAKRLGLKA
ncbi:nitric oxide reductase transcriptional regulator NorR [Halomonas sp. DP4Y7-2]|uniref:nitric oxide reductase transcriptional regulator NorR n=1 Tax=unclassified Halomonas TaxID=2609666 RepID=UPI001C960DA5|nr:nitric oxide reductase transcriptional regulator NorR [Halomonas sp. DP4Y7-2]MBY5926603.1 nitric oxide reductase transcriptional regulator NorR [Halomonas sp. DP4Y7-2]MBY6233684.1 nitric oxide reductase transcriptional regulator NorR [Halomonas sp. DP4Y7-1]